MNEEELNKEEPNVKESDAKKLNIEDIDMNKLNKKIKYLLDSALFESPFMGRYVRKVDIVDVARHIASTDGQKLYLDKKFFGAEISYADAMFVIFHEMYHILLRHTLYINDIGNDQKLAKLFNIAADKAVNSWLIIGRNVRNLVFSKTLEISEELKNYIVLPDEDEEWGESWIYYFERLKQNGGANKKSGGKNGGGNGNNNAYAEIAEGMMNDVKPEKGSDISRRENDLYAKSCLSRGIVPAYIQKELESLINKIDWRKLLRRYISESITADEYPKRFDIQKISRYKVVGNDSIFRRYYKESVKALVIIDVSGSMLGTVDAVVSETKGLVKLYAKNIDVMTWDTEKKGFWSKGSFKNADKIAGFGGTSMASALRAANFDEYNVVILITDGMTDWPNITTKMRKKLILILTEKEMMNSVPKEIKKVVVYEPDKKF